MQAKTDNKVYSARYIATDKETGEVLGSADTYEEALNEWGEEVTITDSEVTEGENMDTGLFSSYDTECAYRDGHEAFFDGKTLDNKPITLSKECSDAWTEGWKSAAHGEENMDTGLFSNKKVIKSSNLPEEVYYIVINGSKQYYNTYEEAEKDLEYLMQHGKSTTVGGVYTETDPEEIAELIDVGYIKSAWKTDNPVRDEGWDAFDKGEQKSDCPYKEGQEREDWLDGWEAAYQEIKSSKKPIKSEVDYDMSYEKEFDDMVEENGYDVNDQFAYMIGIPPEYWTKEDSKACTEYNVKVHGYYILGAEIEGMVVTGRLQDIYDVCDQHFGIGIAPECLSPIDSFDYEDGEWFTGRWLGSSNKSDKTFFAEIVSGVLTHSMSEDQAIKKIAVRNNYNIGFARNIFNEAIKNPDYINSGVMAIADDLNKDFDLDGNIDSWTKEYMENSGNSTTLGGEILRAFNRIDYRYYNDGDMIGRGYGKETVNPAARFLVEKCVGWTEVGNLEDMLNGESDINKSDDYYNEWLEDLKYSLEDYLRNHEEFFYTPNKDDMLDYSTEDDKDAGVTECYFEDGQGNEYWFENDGSGDWKCYEVKYADTPEFEVGDVVSSTQIEHYLDLSPDDEYIDFNIENFKFSAEKIEEDEWEITNIEVEGGLAGEGDNWSVDDLVRETVYDSNGNELSEKDLY